MPKRVGMSTLDANSRANHKTNVETRVMNERGRDESMKRKENIQSASLFGSKSPVVEQSQ